MNLTFWLYYNKEKILKEIEIFAFCRNGTSHCATSHCRIKILHCQNLYNLQPTKDAKTKNRNLNSILQEEELSFIAPSSFSNDLF